MPVRTQTPSRGRPDRGGARRSDRSVQLSAWALSVWSVLYAVPHAYWALGGERGFSVLRPSAVALEEWETINAVATAVLLLPVLVGFGLVRFPARPRIKVALLGAVLAGTSVSAAHGIYGIVYRILNLGGIVEIDGQPASVAEHPWVLWDLLVFEPWFLVEGVLFGLLGWAATTASQRHRWIVLSLVGVSVATASGLLGLRFA